VRIGLDVSAAVSASLSGVGYHILRLVEHLIPELDHASDLVAFFAAHDRDTIRRARALLPAGPKLRLAPVPFVHTRSAKAYRFFRRMMLPWAIRLHACDLFHGPAHVIPLRCSVPTVVTIHDLAFFEHDLYEATYTRSLRESVMSSMNDATSVVALSQYTRDHIRRVSGRSDEVHVVYGAGNYPTAAQRTPQVSDQGKLTDLGITGVYILYVGDFNSRKNLPYLIQAFCHLKLQATWSRLQLVLAGNSSSARQTLEAFGQSLGLACDDLVFPGRVDDETLAILYRNAGAFALCSLGEGFTLVTLEAMSYGVPVVATNTTSIAEGTGTAAELVPLDSAPAVARSFARALAPGPRRDEMARLGRERAGIFTWPRTAHETWAVYARTVRRPLV
jgi:glycosyltransferase involved in cell wall biosynthesis